MAPPAPFFIGEPRRRTAPNTSPNTSRPSTSTAASAPAPVPVPVPVPSPVPLPLSPDPAASAQPSRSSSSALSEPVARPAVTIAHGRHDSIPRLASYHGPRSPVGVPAPVSASAPASPLGPSRASSGVRLRESFAAPPSRPLTLYSSAPSAAPTARRQQRSTLLEDPTALAKPWLTARDPYARLAYGITYAVAFLGIVASAVRCYFGYLSVRMIDAPLCLVLDEAFDGDTDSVFGPSGKWMREVQLGGYGCVLSRGLSLVLTLAGTASSR